MRFAFAVIWGLAAAWMGGELPASEASGRVLLLGDAHCLGSFGVHLDRGLREEGVELHLFADGAGSPYYWLDRFAPISASLGAWEKTPSKERRQEVSGAVPKVEFLVRSCRPELVIVQAGTELYPVLRVGKPEAREKAKAVVDDFCRAISEAHAWIYWIAPPDAHPKRVPPALQSELLEIIREAVGRHQGRVFDSGAVTEWSVPYPELSDGLHYGAVEGRQWAEAVIADFLEYRNSLRGRKPPEIAARKAESTPKQGAPIRARIIAPQGPAGVSDELQVKLILRQKTVIEDAGAIQGGSAFGLFEYEVEKVFQGAYASDRVRVAHLLLLNGQTTAPNRFELGKEYYFSLVEMGKFPSLGDIPLVSQLEGDELPVYICRF